MDLTTIRERLEGADIFFTQGKILGQASVIGYEKKFKWSWLATQMNTFIVATDFEDELITVPLIRQHLDGSFTFANKNYNGWPKGLQSGVGVISILISSQVSPEAEHYCRKLKADKKWAGFMVPAIIDSSREELIHFDKNPMWGRIYYPHFKRLIQGLAG
ncbi:MAG: hypothetical protein AAF206_19535 [Bacteroidota bacterium]